MYIQVLAVVVFFVTRLTFEGQCWIGLGRAWFGPWGRSLWGQIFISICGWKIRSCGAGCRAHSSAFADHNLHGLVSGRYGRAGRLYRVIGQFAWRVAFSVHGALTRAEHERVLTRRYVASVLEQTKVGVGLYFQISAYLIQFAQIILVGFVFVFEEIVYIVLLLVLIVLLVAFEPIGALLLRFVRLFGFPAWFTALWPELFSN